MKKSYKAGLVASVLTASALLVGTSVFAAHPPFGVEGSTLALKDANGAPITLATTPYSPKQTCTANGCHDYGSGTHVAHKTQGVIEGDDQVYWQTYDVTSPAHGANVGRHSQQGRNEDYSVAMRTSFGDPFFTSSPGMFGKF